MAKKKTLERYEVLKPVRNDKTGAYYAAGATVTSQDFTARIIRGWLESSPPVLREVRRGRNT